MKNFETTGTVDESVLAELKWQMVPDKQKKLKIALSALLFVLGILYFLYPKWYLAGSALIVLAVVSVAELLFLPRRYIKMNLANMRESSGCEAYLYTTYFEEDGIRLFNLTNSGQAKYLYSNIVKVVETQRILALATKQNQFVMAFKEGLEPGEKEELLDLLREKCRKLKVVKVR